MENNINGLTGIDTVFLTLPPEELQRFVLSRLDKESLLAARCVSKLWKNLVDISLNFHVELCDNTRSFIESFGESRQVASFSTTAFQGPYPSNGLQIATKMIRIVVGNLDGSENYEDYLQKSRQNPRKNIGISYNNFRGIMDDFSYVEKFQIASLAVKSFTKPQQQLLGRIYLPNVKEMIITFFDGGFHQLLPFMKNHFPKLESVNICNVSESRQDRPLLYSWIYGFVGRHRQTLTETILFHPEGMIGDRGRRGVNDHYLSPPLHDISESFRTDLKMPHHIYGCIKQRLEALTKLKKLNWDAGMLEGQGRYNLGTSLLSSQTALSQLNLDNLQLKDLPVWRQLDKLFGKICETLEVLSLGGIFSTSSVLGDHTFNCSWVKNCKRLKQLKMVIHGVCVESIDELPFETLKFLNLGQMLTQDQIEVICLLGVNLEMWMVPQRGCLDNSLVAKVTRYLFECMIYLPKLTIISLFLEGAEESNILKFVREEPGIRKCEKMCITEQERNGDLEFHIDRQVAIRNHSQLNRFMEDNRFNPDNEMHVEDLAAYLLRNIMVARQLENHIGGVFLWRDDDVEDA